MLVKRLAHEAKKKPQGTKRAIENSLDFKKLLGLYMPTYYVTVKDGRKEIELCINAVNGDVRINA
ncbi:MAG: PepSY domain-containing protein [Candidatus Thorarchaeota archaeon]